MTAPQRYLGPFPDPRTGSYVHPEFYNYRCPAPDRVLSRWLFIGLAVAFVALVGAAVFVSAQAAEPASRPYEITLHYSGKDYDDVSRTHLVLGQPYASKEACRNAIVRVRVEIKGARLVCGPIDRSARR